MFDGIGGFPLAAVHNGITPLWASEIEAFPIKVTKQRFPNMLHVGDITKLNGAELPPVDILTGGSPCQDLSVAGSRRGLAGERSGLFMEQVRIAREMRDEDERNGRSAHHVRPRYYVWENVPGAFSSKNGEDFRAVLEETARIADSTLSIPRPPAGSWKSAGCILGGKFSVAWRVLDARYWGVPQRRKRIFLVADFGGHTAPEILFEQGRLFGDFAEGENAWQGAASPAPAGAGDTGGNCLNAWDTQQSRIFLTNGTAPTLAGADGGGGRNPAGLLFTAGFCAGAAPTAGGIGWQTECSPTLKASESGTNMVPSVLCLNDQGGQRMDVSDDVAGTLRAQMDGHSPLIMATQQGGAEIGEDICPAITASAGMGGDVCDRCQRQLKEAKRSGSNKENCDLMEQGDYVITGNNQPVLYENNPKDGRYNGPLGVAPTLAARNGTGGNNVPLVGKPVAFSLDAKEFNSMKSANSYSGCRETDTARTIDTTNPDPSKNQGGIAILQESYCIAGNIIDRQDYNGGNGFGCQPDISYTLNTADRHAVFSRQRSDEFTENEVIATQSARQYKDATDFICQPYQQMVGTSGFSDHKGINNQFVSDDKCIIEPHNLVRRLTPLECERLQGFPDGWTDLPDASDSARYKALGNSVAIPCVDFVLRGIACFIENAQSEPS